MASRNNKPKHTGASNGDDGLTLKKRLFAAAYHAAPNATQAAIRAGYSAKTAQQAGSRLLKDAGVQAELARLAAAPGGKAPASAMPAPTTAPAPAPAAPTSTTSAQLMARTAAPDREQPEKPLTVPELAFLTEYMRNGNNGMAAWMFSHPGSQPKSAAVNAYQALKRPRMVVWLATERARLALHHQISRDGVMAEFLAIVRADPNELMQMRAVACGNCWGAERETLGRWAEPDPDCPDCMGEGNSVPWFSDTRKLSPEARALFAGVKISKDGATILTHDKMAALVNIGKILGAYEKDNKQKAPELTEALAQFIGQLHGEGAGRLQFTGPRAPAVTPPKVQH